MIWNSEVFACRLLISICLMIIGIVGCQRHAATAIAQFPASNEVEGWTRTGNVRTFSADDLWKYIDGEAERYLKAGVQSASTADYKFHDKVDAVIDIYTMSTDAGAEKIFQSEPATNAQRADVGDEAHLYSQSLIFCKGRYLVRITAYQETANTQNALVAMGRTVEQRLSYR